MVNERVKTGIEGLDEILDGGFLRGATVLLEGPPGSGKTNLGLQILYNGITRYGEPGVLVSFEQFPQQLYRDALGLGMDFQPLREQGLFDIILTNPAKLQETMAGFGSVTHEEIEEVFARIQPKRVLIDSVSHFRRITDDEVQLRELLMQLLGQLTSHGLTAFLTKEIQFADNAPIAFEEYLVDASIRLYNLPSASIGNNRRNLEIRKTRGHHHRSGKHPLRFTSRGIEVFPHRCPEIPPVGQQVQLMDERASSGVRGLDHLLHGGFVRSTTALLAGTTGAGKTTFALHFIRAGLETGEPCLLVALNESPQRVAAYLAGMGVDVTRAMGENRLFIHYVSPVDLCPDRLYSDLEGFIQTHGIRRVVIDSVSDFTPCIRDRNMIRDYLYTYAKLFELRGVTAVLTSELEQVTGPLGMSDINFAFVLDCVIYLGFCEVDSQMRRVIMVLKQRGSGHETHLRELILAPDGPKIGTKFVGLSGVTGGVATGSYQVTIDEMIQPLTFIQGFAEQLRAGQIPPEQQRKVLEQMIAQSNRMIDYLCEYFGIDRAKLLEKK